MSSTRRPTTDDLAALALFGGLPTEGLARIAGLADTVSFPQGTEVFHEGDAARDLFVVVEGSFDVVRLARTGEVPLASLPIGEFFGEMSFVDMQVRAGTVRARVDSVAWRWSYAALHALYLEEPKAFTMLVMNVAREISRRLRRADVRLLDAIDRAHDLASTPPSRKPTDEG